MRDTRQDVLDDGQGDGRTEALSPRLPAQSQDSTSSSHAESAEDPDKIRLRIRAGDLVAAMMNSRGDLLHYLETETSGILTLAAGETQLRRTLDEDIWRYLPLVPLPGSERLRLMSEYLATLSEPFLKVRLGRLLRSGLSYEALRVELSMYPTELAGLDAYLEEKVAVPFRRLYTSPRVEVQIVTGRRGAQS